MRERGRDVIVKIDCGGWMDPQLLRALIHPIVSGDNQDANANRFLCEDRLRKMSTVRLAGAFALTLFTKDVTTLQEFSLGRLAGHSFFETDKLMQINVINADVKDVTAPRRARTELSSMRTGVA